MIYEFTAYSITDLPKNGIFEDVTLLGLTMYPAFRIFQQKSGLEIDANNIGDPFIIQITLPKERFGTRYQIALDEKGRKVLKSVSG